MYTFTIISIWLCLAPLFFLSAGCTYTSISTRQHQVVFKYSDQNSSEKNLPLCAESSVCSILYKRYWLPIIAERLCRCPNIDECPWRWTNTSDDRSMIVNNRSQLKFCSPIMQLKQCSSKKTALVTESITSENKNPLYEIKVNCFCSSENHWKHFKTTQHISKQNSNTNTTIQEFKCSPLKHCNSKEFCGNVRTDHNSIYYSCSCPMGHMCVYKDKTTRNVHELLYKGPAYRAICEPRDTEDDY